MNKKINTILSELYAIDPSLKQHQDQLVKIIDTIITQKPNTHFDKAFVSKLRRQLIQQEPFSMNSYISKFGYLIGGAVVASLVLVPLLSSNQTPGSLLTETNRTAQSKITMLEDKAFGDLAFSPQGYGAAQPEVQNYAITNDTTTDLSAEAPIPTTISSRPQSGGGGDQIEGLTRIADPEFIATQFNFTYAGEQITLDQETLEVLRRNTTPLSVGALASQFGLGLLNLQQFSGLQFESISMIHPNSNVRLHIDTRNGQLSLNKELPIDYYTSSYRAPLRLQDIPDDETILSLANQFIKQYDINLEEYGAPEVSNDFKNQLELVRSNSDYYAPEYTTVVYPLTIRDIPVYDQGGNKQGVQVTIHIPTMQVTSLYGLGLQQFDASAYPIESNIETLIAQKQQENILPPEIVATNVEVQLGTPELVYSFIYDYTNGTERQLYVPAYLFPVLEKPAGHPYYPTNIIAPLVQAFTEQPIRILPAEPLIDTAPAVNENN